MFKMLKAELHRKEQNLRRKRNREVRVFMFKNSPKSHSHKSYKNLTF